ncbi:bacteriocin BlpO [Streptococcus pneumoniae]|nr:bacteriocin BlpO [Streptococcus pneumoniae]
MDFKSFIIGLVVGIFGPYMDDLIRKKFLKSSEKKTEKSEKIIKTINDESESKLFCACK